MEVLLTADLHSFFVKKSDAILAMQIRFHSIPILEKFPPMVKKMCRKNFRQYIGLIVVMVIACINSYGQTPTDSLPPDPGALAVHEARITRGGNARL